MDANHFDIVIVGAGLAGLSLATRLCTPQFAHLRVAIVDPRTTFGATHTWSFFQQAPDASSVFCDCVAATRQWRKIRVAAAGAVSHPHDFSAAPYCSIESTEFYQKCLKIMAGNARIQAFFGHKVIALEEWKSGMAKVTIANKDSAAVQTIEANLVFDSRPPSPAQIGEHAWIQAFAGGEVSCAAPHFAALFARGEAVLMDFIAPSVNPSATIPTFVYVLPSSPTQALVQATAFVPPGANVPTDEALQAIALQYLQTKFADFEITHQLFEAGRIVMDASIPATTSLQVITKIGAAGGFVRASTGYSFTRTQRACDALEKAVLRAFPAGDNKSFLPVAIQWQSRSVPFLDAIFLEAIAAPNFDVGRLMVNLFNLVPPARLVRFLDGNMSFLDALAVVRACPKWVFMRSFFICILRSLRRFTSAFGARAI